MVRSEIISQLSKKIHQKLKKSELEKALEILIKTIVDGIKDKWYKYNKLGNGFFILKSKYHA